MGAGLCPRCRRSVPEAGFLCERCHEDEVARAKAPAPVARQLGQVRRPDDCTLDAETCGCRLHQLLAETRRRLEVGIEARVAPCIVDGRELGYREWADLVDDCACPIHATPPRLTAVPKEHPAA